MTIACPFFWDNMGHWQHPESFVAAPPGEPYVAAPPKSQEHSDVAAPPAPVVKDTAALPVTPATSLTV